MSFSGVDHSSRQLIDVAVGILVGLRGCSRRAAFDELVAVVHQTGAGLGTVASGLVAVASGSASAEDVDAYSIWGELIQRRAAATH
ncbi:ANTAR domain-containing protein [Mycolicibacterium vaccae]|uniref:ANTAR domain-containing protein n=1 Tax=Mycolicibacterium vaccae TaxID=1810 RepID=UPI003CF60948